jgi:hypothetical protein
MIGRGIRKSNREDEFDYIICIFGNVMVKLLTIFKYLSQWNPFVKLMNANKKRKLNQRKLNQRVETIQRHIYWWFYKYHTVCPYDVIYYSTIKRNDHMPQSDENIFLH